MARSGSPIAHEFRSASAPEELIREVVLRGQEFSGFGYRVESHGLDVATLERRYTPTVAWALPLAVAAVAFAGMVLSPNTAATAQGGQIQARVVIFWVAVIAAIVLSLVAKRTERVTLSASADEAGSRVLVSGTATPALRDELLTWGSRPEVGPSADPELSL